MFARQELTTRDLLLLRSGAGLKVYTTSFAAIRVNTNQLFLPCFVGKHSIIKVTDSRGFY